ncbi:uncharacterized protein LOC105215165 [Zeugodacus cucurbitae]|uniref:uncharacterized protein LOC105215165 n=1 Tax=Zeugodacus cucurbitae TaxID=28588 RepID=UPI0023D914C7|nr:uncharacterized protein LOC105215165 [Zeugodacus cucurbitae]
MSPLANSSYSKRAFCGFMLGWTLLVAAVSAQGQRDQFIIRVAELPNDLPNESDSAAGVGGGFNFNFDDFTPNAATDLGGLTIGDVTAQQQLQAPDVVVEGLNLLQRNNLVAAAGNAQAPGPQQRIRMNLNSGLRRRR